LAPWVGFKEAEIGFSIFTGADWIAFGALTGTGA